MALFLTDIQSLRKKERASNLWKLGCPLQLSDYPGIGGHETSWLGEGLRVPVSLFLVLTFVGRGVWGECAAEAMLGDKEHDSCVL